MNSDQLIAKLRILAASLLKKSDYHDMAMVVKSQRQKNIDAGLDINDEPFTPLQESTIKRKRRKGVKDPEKIMVEKGTLRNPAITTTNNSATLKVPASRTIISEVHQNGDAHCPQRQHWGITAEAEKQIRELFEQKVTEVIRRIMKGR